MTNAIWMKGTCQTFDITSTAQNINSEIEVLSNLQLDGNHSTVDINRAGGGTISGNDNVVIYQHGVGRGNITTNQRFTVSGQRDTVKRIIPKQSPIRQ